jgi:hypothetical protein
MENCYHHQQNERSSKEGGRGRMKPEKGWGRQKQRPLSGWLALPAGLSGECSQQVVFLPGESVYCTEETQVLKRESKKEHQHFTNKRIKMTLGSANFQSS